MFFRIIYHGCLIMMLLSQNLYANTTQLNMEWQEVNLPDAIRMMARMVPMNVIISPAVTGYANLHVTDAPPLQTLDVLLMSHGLARWPYGNVWYVAPQDELMKRKQDELKWQSLSEE